jgi:hypothetical protein
MREAGLLVLSVACLITAYSLPATAGAPAEQGTSVQVEKPVPPPVENNQGYRPRWADPDAKSPEPGVENDPTPFDPSDVDANSDTLNNNLNNIDQ